MGDTKQKVDKKGSKSAHDLLNDPKLSNAVGDEFKDLGDDDDDDTIEEQPEKFKDDDKADLTSIRDKLKKSKPKVAPPPAKPSKAQYLDNDTEALDYEYDDDPEEAKMKKKREEIKREIKELTREMKRGHSTKDPERENDTDKNSKKENELTEEEKSNDMLREYHQEQAKAKKAKEAKGIPKKGSSAREAQTLAMLAKFQQKLTSVKEDNEDKKESVVDEEDEIEGGSWMSNTLKFQNDDPILAKDANTKGDDWFDIYDPRNPLNKRRRKEDAKNRRK